MAHVSFGLLEDMCTSNSGGSPFWCLNQSSPGESGWKIFPPGEFILSPAAPPCRPRMVRGSLHSARQPFKRTYGPETASQRGGRARFSAPMACAIACEDRCRSLLIRSALRIVAASTGVGRWSRRKHPSLSPFWVTRQNPSRCLTLVQRRIDPPVVTQSRKPAPSAKMWPSLPLMAHSAHLSRRSASGEASRAVRSVSSRAWLVSMPNHTDGHSSVGREAAHRWCV